MIIWINGSFGSGKTTVSKELNRLIDDSYIFDPEEVGFLIRDNIPPSLQKNDFQDFVLWREFNYRLLSYMASKYSGDIIVPMTIDKKSYLDEIIETLRTDGHTVKHFTLIASGDTLASRINGRGIDNNEWVHNRAKECVVNFQNSAFEGKIDTEQDSADKIAKTIFNMCFV